MPVRQLQFNCCNGGHDCFWQNQLYIQTNAFYQRKIKHAIIEISIHSSKLFWYLWHFGRSFVTNYDLIVEFFVREGCSTVGQRERCGDSSTSLSNKHFQNNRDKLLGKVHKYSRHLNAKPWLFMIYQLAKQRSVDPTLRQLEEAFLRKCAQRDLAPWRDYVSVRYKPVYFMK